MLKGCILYPDMCVCMLMAVVATILMNVRKRAFRAAIRAHQKHGATSIFPTLSSSPFSEIRKAVAVCETLMNEKDSPVLGLHVEGPYLNPKRAGEQFAGKLKNPDKEEYTSLLESTDCIKRWDASPELPGALEFARYLKSKGVLVAVSHTESEYEGIKAAFEAGFTHTAHFYNACRDSINVVNINTKGQWKVFI